MDNLDALALMAYDEAPVGLVMTEHRVIRTCNRRFAGLFGYEKSELIGQSFRMLYRTQREFDRIRDIGLGPLEQGATYSDERIMHHKDGSGFWCRFRAQTLNPKSPLSRTVLSFAHLAAERKGVALTPRERDVVAYLSQGMTSKEIARQLSRSPRTIEDVRARLMRKFEVRNASELLTKLGSLEE